MGMGIPIVFVYNIKKAEKKPPNPMKHIRNTTILEWVISHPLQKSDMDLFPCMYIFFYPLNCLAKKKV